jgi:hypothetical protein
VSLQARLAQLGLAKQSAKGTPAGAPTYTVGLVSGAVYDAEHDQSDLNTTWDRRGLQGHDRISITPIADGELIALPKSLGLMLALGCGAEAYTAPTVTTTLSAASIAGATSISTAASIPNGTVIAIDSGANYEVVTTSGAPTGTGPYTIPVPALKFAHASGATAGSAATHTFTPGVTLPWATLFGMYGGAAGVQTTISDAKVDSIELSWDKTGAVKVKIKFLGRTFTFATPWTVGTTGEQIGGGKLFKGTGGLFNVNGVQARVISGSIKIENKLTSLVAAYSATPDEFVEGDVVCSTSLVIAPDDLNLFRQVITGSSSGTAVQSTPVYGQLDLKWLLDAVNTLEFKANNVAFLTKMPAVDPNGKHAEITLEGSCEVVAGTPSDPFSVILTNLVAAAY